MLPQTILLTLTALLSTAVSAQRNVKSSSESSSSKDFTGLGQLRALYIRDDHEDLGCLTKMGKWTVNEAQCGNFAAVQIKEGQFHLVAAGVGGCGIEGATFKCAKEVKVDTFGTWGTNGPIPGREVLRYAQYGVLATDAPDSPPSLEEEPLPVHFYSGIEKGKWVWLAWKPLFEHGDDY